MQLDGTVEGGVLPVVVTIREKATQKLLVLQWLNYFNTAHIHGTKVCNLMELSREEYYR